MERFTPIPLDNVPLERQASIHRLNCLGSLFYFAQIALRKKKLTKLHFGLCRLFEKDHIKDVVEWPRDHFKTTTGSEALPMWRVLPFSNKDEDMFRAAGYSDEFVQWQRRCHNPLARNLLVAENITNAAKIGLRIRKHYESNAVYRSLFPETLPDTSCIWSNYSLHIKRPSGANPFDFSPNGEGTFDFLGVGGALQSRHYNALLVQDDLVGRRAIESPSVMERTKEYHQLLVGAFDSEDAEHENDELVIGNRWDFFDVNSFIREHEPWFNITTHSALGGCCAEHPPDQPIMPEWFSFEKLMKLKERLGVYHFSCQFLNNPAAPDQADFKTEWLNYFHLIKNKRDEWTVQYEVKDGVVRSDLPTRKLSITLVVDPAHSGNAGTGRCRHAIVVVGQDREGNYYLIETWTGQGSYDAFFNKIFELAEKWKVRHIGFESVAAQKFAVHHIEYMNRDKGWHVRVEPLRGEVEGPNGEITRKKEWRIRTVLGPIFEQGRFFVQRTQQDFIGEYQGFPKAKFVDQLDALAYAPQMLRIPMSYAQVADLIANNQRQLDQINKPYCAAMN